MSYVIFANRTLTIGRLDGLAHKSIIRHSESGPSSAGQLKSISEDTEEMPQLRSTAVLSHQKKAG